MMSFTRKVLGGAAIIAASLAAVGSGSQAAVDHQVEHLQARVTLENRQLQWSRWGDDFLVSAEVKIKGVHISEKNISVSATAKRSGHPKIFKDSHLTVKRGTSIPGTGKTFEGIVRFTLDGDHFDPKKYGTTPQPIIIDLRAAWTTSEKLPVKICIADPVKRNALNGIAPCKLLEVRTDRFYRASEIAIQMPNVDRPTRPILDGATAMAPSLRVVDDRVEHGTHYWKLEASGFDISQDRLMVSWSFIKADGTILARNRSLTLDLQDNGVYRSKEKRRVDIDGNYIARVGRPSVIYRFHSPTYRPAPTPEPEPPVVEPEISPLTPKQTIATIWEEPETEPSGFASIDGGVSGSSGACPNPDGYPRLTSVIGAIDTQDTRATDGVERALGAGGNPLEKGVWCKKNAPGFHPLWIIDYKMNAIEYIDQYTRGSPEWRAKVKALLLEAIATPPIVKAVAFHGMGRVANLVKVRLAGPPRDTATVVLSASGGGVEVAPSEMSFSSSDWDVWRIADIKITEGDIGGTSDEEITVKVKNEADGSAASIVVVGAGDRAPTPCVKTERCYQVDNEWGERGWHFGVVDVEYGDEVHLKCAGGEPTSECGHEWLAECKREGEEPLLEVQYTSNIFKGLSGTCEFGTRGSFTITLE